MWSKKRENTSFSFQTTYKPPHAAVRFSSFYRSISGLKGTEAYHKVFLLPKTINRIRRLSIRTFKTFLFKINRADPREQVALALKTTTVLTTSYGNSLF